MSAAAANSLYLQLLLVREQQYRVHAEVIALTSSAANLALTHPYLTVSLLVTQQSHLSTLIPAPSIHIPYI